MKNNRIGIIYKYTSPSGKIYIGQNMNEKERRKKFLGKSSVKYTQAHQLTYSISALIKKKY